MKKTLLLTLIAVVVVALSFGSAFAASISPGDKIKLTAYNPDIPLALTPGGEFSMLTDKGVSFTSFCLEVHESISLGSFYTIESIVPYATGGGGGAIGGKDPLSGKTAWLYYMFYTGKLASDFGYVKGDATKGEDALQLAIWKLEDEYTGPLGVYSHFYDLVTTGGYGWRDDDLHGVVAINPVGADGSQRQSVLYVPESLTLLLLGLGLAGLAGVRRKK